MNSVETYITDFPNEEVQLLLHETHQFLLQVIPQVETAIKWKVPFYTYIKPLCYLSPINSKTSRRGDGVYLGFMNGYLMSSDYTILKTEGRKQIKVVYIHQVEDLYQEELMAILQEAMLLNE